MTQRKNISMPDELAQYIEDENINLSRFVQEKIQEEIKAKSLEQELKQAHNHKKTGGNQ